MTTSTPQEVTPLFTQQMNVLCEEVCRTWPWQKAYEVWISHLLHALQGGEVSHLYIEQLPGNRAQLLFRADGVVVRGVIFSDEQYSKLQEALHSRFLRSHSNDSSTEGIIQDGEAFYWLGLLKTSHGTSLSLLRRRGKSAPPIQWTQQAREAWQEMMKKPNGLSIFCHRGWSTDNAVLRVIDSIAQEDKRSRLACVSESLQNISLRDDVTSLCIDGSKKSWREALQNLVAHDFDVIALSGRNEKEVVRQAVSTALEDRRVLVSVSFPSAVETLMWLLNDPEFDVSQVTQVLLGVIGNYDGLMRNCSSCFERQQPTDEQTDLLHQHGFDIHSAKFGQSRGCRDCFQTGFENPRYTRSEAVFVDKALANVLSQKPSREQIEEILRKNGWKSCLEQSLKYAMQGEAPLDEALRIGLARRADL